MKKLYLLFICSLFMFISLPVWADVDLSPLLNKVSLQLNAEQWITTKTAVVSVSVNAAVADQDLGSVQNTVMDKLKKLSDKGDWHIISLTRQLDQSGLERVQITAQARLAQTDLSDLRNKAKSMSKPGETFTIDDVSFIPSNDEISQANIVLRNNIYQQVKNEIDVLNKMYPNQNFYLYSIDFNSLPPVSPQAASTMFIAGKANVSRAPAIAIGNKAQLQATVVIASMPEVVSQKISSH